MFGADHAGSFRTRFYSPVQASDSFMWLQVVAGACLGWYFFILTVSAIGVVQLQRHYSRTPSPPVSPGLPNSDVPHVTILRPVKGLEPYLYECLAATFRQTYPSNRLTIYFCISSRNDPAISILERLLSDFPSFEAHILVEEEDPNLTGQNGEEKNLGPNPKIRNMSRGYREAKGDIIWIIDCNVWISKIVAGLMVDQLCGFSPRNKGRKYKFVHQLPLVVDISKHNRSQIAETTTPLSSSSPNPTRTLQDPLSLPSRILSSAGSLLEELFLSTSHAKFYTAISTVAVAPCTVGKSNMFRPSHLNALTPSTDLQRRSPGIDFFSHNICEDHLIGDLLWKSPVPDSVLEKAAAEGGASAKGQTARGHVTWGNHALLPSPPCIQPLSNLPLSAYTARRARWLRVRKFTVPVATLVEPGTESLLCSLYGAFGFTTLEWCNETLGIPRTWSAFWLLWTTSVLLWMFIDWMVWNRLQGGMGMDADEETPAFVTAGWAEKGQKGKASEGSNGGNNNSIATTTKRRSFREWLLAWLGRELLAGPIWAWAVFGGTTVLWRGRKFWVGMDMRVHEVEEGKEEIRGRDQGRGRREDGLVNGGFVGEEDEREWAGRKRRRRSQGESGSESKSESRSKERVDKT